MSSTLVTERCPPRAPVGDRRVADPGRCWTVRDRRTHRRCARTTAKIRRPRPGDLQGHDRALLHGQPLNSSGRRPPRAAAPDRVCVRRSAPAGRPAATGRRQATLTSSCLATPQQLGCRHSSISSRGPQAGGREQGALIKSSGQCVDRGGRLLGRRPARTRLRGVRSTCAISHSFAIRTGGHQRVAARVESVVEHADVAAIEHFAEHPDHQGSRWTTAGRRSRAARCGWVGVGAGVAVEFAVGVRGGWGRWW